MRQGYNTASHWRIHVSRNTNTNIVKSQSAGLKIAFLPLGLDLRLGDHRVVTPLRGAQDTTGFHVVFQIPRSLCGSARQKHHTLH